MRKLGMLAIHLLALSVGLFVCFYPTFLSGFDRMQTNDGDTVLNHYLLEHSYLWVFDSKYPFSFWSPGFFYPTKSVLTYSENMIGMAPFYWCFRFVFADTVAYQLWMILPIALNYISLAWVFRRWRVPFLWNVGLCYVFAFGLLRCSQMCHQQLYAQFPSVLAVYCLREFLIAPSLQRWIGFWFFLTWQCLSSIYIGWFLCLGAAVFSVALLLVDRKALRPTLLFFLRKWFSFSAVAGAFLGLLGSFFIHYQLGNDGPRDYDTIIFYMPDYRGLFTSCDHSIWSYPWGMSNDTIAVGECRLSNGYILYALLFSTAYLAWKSPATAVRSQILALFATCAFLLIACLNLDEGLSIWQWIHQTIPGAKSLRAIGRIAFQSYLFGILAIGLASSHFTCKLFSPSSVWPAAIVFLMIGEQAVWKQESIPKREFYDRAIEMSRAFDGYDVLYFNCSGEKFPDVPGEMRAVWAGLYARKPVVNGYSGRVPNEYPANAIQTDSDLIEFVQPRPNIKFGRVEETPNGLRVRPLSPGNNMP